ncbi:UvrD-helicase domain-containing protein [Inquilinus limosus]|uniref:UvrD-helicase domain-containing protein n=1 Tax=Inquilinus limosus TaxID=171674 RepID=UPI003F160F13
MTAEEFEALVGTVLGEHRRPNRRQMDCIASPLHPATLIVAGPGTGKTSVLVLRALRHLLVDQMEPETILITTFTVKAAKEIRTRILEWGEPMLNHLRGPSRSQLSPEYAAFLDRVDVNRFITGTLDGICQETLTEQRVPGERRFVIVEGFAANVILLRAGEVARERGDIADLDAYLAQFTMFGQPPRNNGEAVRIIRTIIDRFIQDGVDVPGYVRAGGPFPGPRAAIGRIYDRYTARLRADHQMDFSLLERLFLERIEQRRVPDRIANLRAILVDEYQDTNPLQERLYLELARSTGAALTVVGDDDQSLYRFRGATIELFRNFRARASEVLQEEAGQPLYLVDNYRSAPEIIDFYNAFITCDPDFGPARINPPKPAIVPTRCSQNMPVLGLFRDSATDLAAALSSFLHKVFREGGRPADDSLGEDILPAAQGGDLGDAVLLAPTVSEYTNSGRERLPSLLRAELQNRGLSCFNPRGRALRDIPEVQQLLGLVLTCLEPASPALSIDGVAGQAPAQMRITNDAIRCMNVWRAAAQRLIHDAPGPVNGRALSEIIERWRRFAADGTGSRTASEWPLLDVFYSFIPWLPAFRDDPEGQVYLEAISRCAAQAGTVSPYRGLILRDNPHRQRSIWVAVRDVLAPIAEDLVDVDEEIMPSVPRNRLNIMTIHQAKGLEFPLVIVDVASDYIKNNHMQRFRRFPNRPSPAVALENELAPHTPIGRLRLQRTEMQRSFEDLIRQYYVAYSRPQSLLMLVGCRQNIRYTTTIQNVATWWRRDETWAWQSPVAGARPVLANNLPLTLI